MYINTSELYLNAMLLIINAPSEATYSLVSDVLEIYEQDLKTTVALDDELTRTYIGIIKQILEKKVSKDSPDELRMLLVRFRTDPTLKANKEVYELLYDIFTSEDQMSQTKIEEYYDSVKNAFLWHKCNKGARSIYGNLGDAANTSDIRKQKRQLRQIQLLANDLSDVFDRNTTAEDNGMVEAIDMTDIASIVAGVKKFRETKVDYVIKTGLQGLNRATGEHQGFARGESIVFNAPSHMYKSGILTSCAYWIPAYNYPPTGLDGKKPLIYIASLENEANANLMWMFKKIYFMDTGNYPDGMSDEAIAQYVQEFFTRNGFHVIIERYLPSNFGFREYMSRIESFERSGYVVIAAIIDYMNNMKKEDGAAKNLGSHLQVKALYQNMCNYNKSKAITQITAHQLNREAQNIARSGITDVVKHFGPHMLADSMDVQREVDLEFYMYIEQNNLKESYLTMLRGKHRYVDNTPEAHKYVAYKFEPYGIPDDINGEDLSVSNIYATMKKEGDTSTEASTSLF